MSVDRAVRRAVPSDAEGIARVHVASADESLAPHAREWPALDLAQRTERWAASLRAADRLVMVGTVADELVGFIAGGSPRKQTMLEGFEIHVVHVLPTHRGAGIGGQLWDLACASLRGPALEPLYLETLAELHCCAFYDARGGEVLSRTAGTFFGGAVTFLTYHWPAGKPHLRRRGCATLLVDASAGPLGLGHEVRRTAAALRGGR